jgi:hypothetical protein
MEPQETIGIMARTAAIAKPSLAGDAGRAILLRKC